MFDELTPESVLADLRPDVYCKGGDYAGDMQRVLPERHVIETYGGRIVFLPDYEDHSTTSTVSRAGFVPALRGTRGL